MQDLIIDSAHEADIPFMLELWRNTPGVDAGDDEIGLAAFIRRNPETCLLIRTGTAITGTVLGGFDGRRGYIYHLAIHPDYQRRGWGTRILQEALARLEALKAEKIHLFVFRDNQGAQAFYERQAWTRRQDIEVFTYKPKK